MNQPVIIAVQSYLMKRGVASVLRDIEETEVIFMDKMVELNKFLEENKAKMVILGQELLESKQEWDLFFQLKNNTTYIVLAHDTHCLPAKKQFDYVLSRESSKSEILHVLEKIVHPSEQNTTSSSLLSEREVEVLKLVALGYTNQQIAEQLFISKHTVISHRKKITTKLGIKTVSGLTVYAVLNDLIPKDQIQ